MKIYHNNMCSKSRACCTLLEDKGVEIEIVPYLETPMNKEELTDLLVKLNIPAKDLIRKGEEVYLLNFKDKELTEEQWVNAMVTFPILIERPIVVKGNKAVIGRPIEKVVELLAD